MIFFFSLKKKNVDLKLKELPSSSSQYFQTILETRCAPYLSLAKEENQKNVEAWDKTVEKNKKELGSDKNMVYCLK